MGSSGRWLSVLAVAGLCAAMGVGLVNHWGTQLPPPPSPEKGVQAHGRCPDAPTYRPSISHSAARAGSRVVLSGAVPVQNEAGNYVGPGDGKLVLWWNLDPEQWPTALAPEIESPVPARANEPVVKLGRVFPRGHCRYAMSFEVPRARPGR